MITEKIKEIKRTHNPIGRGEKIRRRVEAREIEHAIRVSNVIYKLGS